MCHLHKDDPVIVKANGRRGVVEAVRVGRPVCLVRHEVTTHKGETVNVYVEYKESRLERIPQPVTGREAGER